MLYRIKQITRIPLKTLSYIVGVWGIINVLNRIFLKFGFYSDVPYWFPISIFSGPVFHLYGLPFVLMFLIILMFSVKIVKKLNIYHIWMIGFFLIILGNLGQGNVDSAFLKPFYESGMQYYHDAIKISDWINWTSNFNINQAGLLTHTKTHPPFAILIHYFLLKISGGDILFLSFGFILLSSLSIIFVGKIFETIGIAKEKVKLITLLFSVLPAINIYSAVSLDGVILTGSVLFLYGLLKILTENKISKPGLLYAISGIVFTNLLSFGGIFFIAVFFIQSVVSYYYKKESATSYTFGITLTVLIILLVLLNAFFNYNHIDALLNASKSENPNGFRGIYDPLNYIATRLECITEILLFLSLGFLAVIFHPKMLNISHSDFRIPEVSLFFSAIFILILFFISGAFYTGETARATMFIYPYFLFLLVNTKDELISDLIKFAGIQTACMQLFGSYFW